MRGLRDLSFLGMAAGLVFLFIISSGCLDSGAISDYGINGTSTGSCSPGYFRYTTSSGQCCPTGYPYYYNGTCHACSRGYNKYDTSAGYCCPAGYTYYYDGTCHQCSRGSYTYDTSGGRCCPAGYPYYYDGACHTKSSGSGTPVSYGGGSSTVVVDSRSGCPVQSNLECSQWIVAEHCQIQSCTCYYSGLHGDSLAAYYHTSDNAYFPCSGTGQVLSCTDAVKAATLHCA